MGSRYCIVGAGPTGLAVARAFKRDGIEFDLYERFAGVGGIWDIANADSPIYENTQLISSRAMSGFPGYAMSASYPDYPRHDQVLAYLRAFAEHYDLLAHITFETSVSQVEPSGQSWAVTLEGGECHRYEGVVIASGHNWDSRLPAYPGAFAGESFHSSEYRAPERLAGQRVLVVGGGNSACDIACDILATARSVSLSLRRGYYFLPKYVAGVPADQAVGSPKVPALAVAMMLSAQARKLEPYGAPIPTYRPFEANPVVNSRIIEAITSHAVKVKPDVERLCGKRVRFDDATEETYDRIVYATGYRHTIPVASRWLTWHDGRPDLFLNMFPRSHDRVAVVGLFEIDGSAFPVASAQAELLSSVVRAQRGNGKARRRFEQARCRDIDLSGGRRYVPSERHSIAVNREVYLAELTSLAAALDAAPARPFARPRRSGDG